jgi:hypothetical protein
MVNYKNRFTSRKKNYFCANIVSQDRTPVKNFENKYSAIIMKNTSQEYDAKITICRDLFVKKMKDYGSAWRILRLPSLTDQIYIKAQRIRGLQENKVRKIEEDEQAEFIGIINYSIMALIQIELGVAEQPDLETSKAVELYDAKVATTKSLMENKNHDYGEAWREMRVNSLTDLILQKLLRVKQIEDNKGKTIIIVNKNSHIITESNRHNNIWKNIQNLKRFSENGKQKSQN